MTDTAKIIGLSPQLLVDDLPAAIAYYRDALGFTTDFIYESFYASVSRDGFSIHLKCAPKSDSDGEQRKQDENLDAYVAVLGIERLYEELTANGARIIRELETQPWACKEFYVEDIDGHVLCFGEQIGDTGN